HSDHLQCLDHRVVPAESLGKLVRLPRELERLRHVAVEACEGRAADKRESLLRAGRLAGQKTLGTLLVFFPLLHLTAVPDGPHQRKLRLRGPTPITDLLE